MLDASGRAMVRRIIRARIEKLQAGLTFGPASMHAVIRAEIAELQQEAIRLEWRTTPRTLVQREPRYPNRPHPRDRSNAAR